MVEVSRSEHPTPQVVLERDGVAIGFAVNGGDSSQDGAAIQVADVVRARWPLLLLLPTDLRGALSPLGPCWPPVEPYRPCGAPPWRRLCRKPDRALVGGPGVMRVMAGVDDATPRPDGSQSNLGFFERGRPTWFGEIAGGFRPRLSHRQPKMRTQVWRTTTPRRPKARAWRACRAIVGWPTEHKD